MGGDGGTIGASRVYMRGAGTASHTADAIRHKAQQQQSESDRYQAMTHCALTGAPLDIDRSRQSGGGVVACPYGRMYNREAALEALLTRRTTNSNHSSEALLGDHVRGMKDLYPVRFEITTESKDENRPVPVCPVTRTELNGSQPAILIVNKKKSKKSKSKHGGTTTTINEGPNVLCERVMKEMGLDALQMEYGPFGKDDIVKLAPPTSGPVWEDIKEKVYQQQHSSTEKRSDKGGDIVVSTKKQKDKKHKIITVSDKHKNDNKEQRKKKQKREERNQHRSAAGNGGAVAIAKANAASAVASSAALSSLFTASSSGKRKDESENGPAPFSQGLRNNDLFAR